MTDRDVWHVQNRLKTIGVDLTDDQVGDVLDSAHVEGALLRKKIVDEMETAAFQRGVIFERLNTTDKG